MNRRHGNWLTRRSLTIVLVIALLTSLLGGSAGSAAEPKVEITIFATDIAGPSELAAGSDGNLWFTSPGPGNNSIGRITLTPTDCEPAATGPFADVSSAHPFCGQIGAMSTSGISSGFADGTFRPTTAVSRQAMAGFLHRLAGEPEVTLSAAFFADVPPAHPFYVPNQWMGEVGLSTGTVQPDAKPAYQPTNAVSRQAMAAFLHRYDQSARVPVG